MDEVVELGRSWSYAPEIKIESSNYISHGFDMSERCYQIENKNSRSKKLKMKVAADQENPLFNPAFFIKNWSSKGADILVNGKPAQDARTGINHELEGDDLVVFLFLQKTEPVEITILPR